jgi:hypothetical protein
MDITKISEEFTAILENFNNNIESINELMTLDALIQDLCIKALESSVSVIKKDGYADRHPCLTPLNNALVNMKQIRKNESLGPYYEVVYNQSLVLLVSYFAFTLQDLFCVALTNKIASKNLGTIANEEFKVSLVELYAFDSVPISQAIADLLIAKKDISFQDMRSIARTFKEYIGYEPVQDTDVNNIISGQACRHAIVHYGAIANEKTIAQILKATPRDIKIELTKDQKIVFTPDEIKMVGDSMKKYAENLIKKTCDVLIAS